MKPLHLILWPLLALACGSAHAASARAENWSEGELALVGPYCIDTMGWRYGDAYYNTSPRAKHWVGLMGRCFWHMHHYCNGMMQLRRASFARMAERGYLYDVAANEIGYVLKACNDASFVMLPELYSRLGDIELLRNRPTAALTAYEAARKAKPSYVPAYKGWAEYLQKTKLTAQALALVSEGLSHAPDSPELLRMYQQLGGDMKSLPKPVAPPAAEAASAPAVQASAAAPDAAASAPVPAAASAAVQ